jgi:hypothetical protein
VNLVTTGNDEIGRVLAGYVTDYGMRYESASPVIQLGRTAAIAGTISSTLDPGTEQGLLAVVRLAPNGKIAHQWVFPADQ